MIVIEQPRVPGIRLIVRNSTTIPHTILTGIGSFADALATMRWLAWWELLFQHPRFHDPV